MRHFTPQLVIESNTARLKRHDEEEAMKNNLLLVELQLAVTLLKLAVLALINFISRI
jgi:hypothetical protein